MVRDIKLFVAVKACIINEEREVLLIRESSEYADGTNTTKYDVPGGRIEKDEKLSDALVREVMEETGLVVKTSELIDVHDTFNEKGNETWHIVRLFYSVVCEKGEIVLSKDHDQFVWVSFDDVEHYPGIIENLIPTLKKYKHM